MLQTKGTRAGFTLLEITIGLALLGSIMGSVLYVLGSSSGAYRTNILSGELDAKAELTLSEVTRRMRSSQADWLTPPAPTGSELQWDYQQAVGILAGVPTPGPVERFEFQYDPGDPDDGLDNDGDGLIDEGQVVWTEAPGQPTERSTILTRWVREAPPGEVLGNGLDDDGNGLVDDRGFSIQQLDGHLVVRLTLERADHSGAVLTKSVQRTVTLRN